MFHVICFLEKKKNNMFHKPTKKKSWGGKLQKPWLDKSVGAVVLRTGIDGSEFKISALHFELMCFR